MESSVSVDVIIIGGGIAGLTAAYAASKNESSVLIITCGAQTSKHIVGLNVTDKEGSSKYFNDIYMNGQFINDSDLVSVLSNQSINILEFMKEIGVTPAFHNGKVVNRLTLGSSVPRTIYTEDERIGGIILTNLERQIRQKTNANVFNGLAIHIEKTDQESWVIIAYDLKQKALVQIQAKAVVLANGGIGRIYEYSSNPPSICGWGYALAYFAKAELVDMEFPSFEPLGTIYPTTAKGITTPTSIIAEGARLINGKGQEFLDTSPPISKDNVTRAIYNESMVNPGPNGGIILDLSNVGDEDLKRYATLKKPLRDVYIERGHLEVLPLYQSFNGGVKIGTSCETTIQGMFAAGEVAGGIHGANRMAGNSGTDVLVMGYHAGINASHYVKETGGYCGSRVKVDIQLDEGKGKNINYNEIQYKLKQIMWENVGVIRNQDGLEKAWSKLLELREEASLLEASCLDRFIKRKELENTILLSQLITLSATLRKESRGDHFRADYPYRDDINWKKRIILQKKTTGTEYTSQSVGLIENRSKLMEIVI